ncbi:MAG: IS5/IS1182 family transposase, partial [Acidimicrobiaceae bacterium]|nr:IS5/IS1182 family transposase [Acidimicrobiaceae bacterium]
MLALEPRVVDALWVAFEPQIPERGEVSHPLGCHRRRIADRDVLVLRVNVGLRVAGVGVVGH